MEWWSVDVGDRIIPLLQYSISAYKKDMPPSTLIVWPVMKSLSGETRNNITPTTSLGIWMRLSERSATDDSLNLIICLVGFSSESVLPGARQLTVILSSPTSRARVRVKPMVAAFDVT